MIKRPCYYLGLVALVAFDVLDWPLALVIGVGHLLADNSHHAAIKELGEALEEA